jgi:hypothetical protein
MVTTRLHKRALPGLLLIGLVAGLILFGCVEKRSNNSSQPGSGADSTKADSLTIELTGLDSVTVFDLLRTTHAIEFKSSAIGLFVRGIDSVMNSQSHFWTYTVNDTTPQIACDRCLTRTGDRVLWHYRKSSR